MTDENKPTPQRFQRKSSSPMADGSAPIVKAGEPEKRQHKPSRPGPKPGAKAATLAPAAAASARKPMSAPTEAELEAMRPAEEKAEVAEDAAPAVTASTRVPFGTQRAKLAVPEREGFTRRWFNDEPGRIAAAQDAGYVHVMDRKNRPLERVVTKSADKSGGMKAFCMEIPNEFYDADFAAKQEALDIVDMQIKNAPINAKPGDSQYVPPDTIKFGVTRGLGR